MNYRHFLVASGALFLAGLAILTLPEEPLPSMAWRFHFGMPQWLVGVVTGMGLGAFLSPAANRSKLSGDQSGE